MASDLLGLTGLLGSIFGSDTSGNSSSSGGTTGTVSKDSGHVDTTTTQNSGETDTNTSTTQNNSITANSGSKNTITTGPSTSTTTNSGSTNTSQLLLSQDAVNYIVKGILEGTSGLASVATAQRQSGAYNSTTDALLTNDLLARTAGEVAARSAVTKTVIGGSTSTTENSGNTVTQDIGGSTSATASTSTTSGTTVKGPSTQTATTNVGSSEVDQLITKSPTYTTSEQGSSGLFGKITDTLGWIICTELWKQGRMQNRHFIAGHRHFQKYDSKILKGYYIWAVPSTRHLRRCPNSIYSKFLEAVFCSRAKYLAGEGGLKDAIAAGTVHAFCWILSRTIARNYKQPDYAIQYAGI